MQCNEALRVQEYFDGELETGSAVTVERHLESCAECAALLAHLEATRSLLREHVPYHRADRDLRARIAVALDRNEGGRSIFRPSFGRDRGFLFGAISGAGMTALAASLAFFLLLPAGFNPLVDAVEDAHLRSLASDRLIDVASSDRHTVKPWFAGHADVSPPADDFAKEGYTLIGGRTDFVDGHRAAVVVYRHGAHVIDVFAWAAIGRKLPDSTTRNGYHMIFWKSGDLDFCAVSDTGLDELLGLAGLVKAAAVAQGRE